MKARRTNPERHIQRAVLGHLKARAYPGVVYWHSPNGGKRNLREAVNLKRDGVLPGVADLCAVHDGKFFALELKSDTGRPTEAQLAFIAAVNSAGGYAGWAQGLDRALSMLCMWGILRPEPHLQEPRP